MVVVYCLTPELRDKLKKPFGLLIRGPSAETMKEINLIINREKPSRVISVGDKVSRNLQMYGIEKHLTITDNRSLRRRVQPTKSRARKLFHARNPPGTITEEAMTAVKEALRGEEDAHIIIDGEEDLLTLIAILYAPKDALVVYGQPYEGVVAVEVTEEKRAVAKKLLEEMACSKAK